MFHILKGLLSNIYLLLKHPPNKTKYLLPYDHLIHTMLETLDRSQPLLIVLKSAKFHQIIKQECNGTQQANKKNRNHYIARLPKYILQAHS